MKPIQYQIRCKTDSTPIPIWNRVSTKSDSIPILTPNRFHTNTNQPRILKSSLSMLFIFPLKMSIFGSTFDPLTLKRESRRKNLGKLPVKSISFQTNFHLNFCMSFWGFFISMLFFLEKISTQQIVSKSWLDMITTRFVLCKQIQLHYENFYCHPKV